jgi:hypothetical protein
VAGTIDLHVYVDDTNLAAMLDGLPWSGWRQAGFRGPVLYSEPVYHVSAPAHLVHRVDHETGEVEFLGSKVME